MLDVKMVLNTRHIEKFFKVLDTGADRYLRPELADGLDHSSRRFFKNLWQREMQGPPGIKAYPRGIFHHFYRQPLGGVGGNKILGKPVAAARRSSTVRTFMNSKAKTMDMGIELYTDSEIAKAHAEGESRTSKKGGKLAVPMPPKIQPYMYDSRGRLKSRYKRPETQDLFRAKLRGQVYLCKRYKKSGRINPMYVLKNRIPVRKRVRYRELFDSMKPEFTVILDKAFRKGLNRFWKEA